MQATVILEKARLLRTKDKLLRNSPGHRELDLDLKVPILSTSFSSARAKRTSTNECMSTHFMYVDEAHSDRAKAIEKKLARSSQPIIRGSGPQGPWEPLNSELSASSHPSK